MAVRPIVPWFIDNLKKLKTKRMKLERVMIKSRLQCDKDAYRKVRDAYSALLNETRKTYYSNLIDECAGDWKKLFQIVNSLSKERQDTELPQHEEPFMLANEFGDFFYKKIELVKAEIDNVSVNHAPDVHLHLPQVNWRTFLRSRRMKFEGSSLNLLMLVANWIPSLCGLLNSAVMYWPQSLLKW